jgi:hypothetical protein
LYVLEKPSNCFESQNQENPPSEGCSYAAEDSGREVLSDPAWKKEAEGEGDEEPQFPEEPALTRVGKGSEEDPKI